MAYVSYGPCLEFWRHGSSFPIKRFGLLPLFWHSSYVKILRFYSGLLASLSSYWVMKLHG